MNAAGGVAPGSSAVAVEGQDEPVHIHSEVTGDGPAVLLTHGFAASSHMFASTVPAVVAAGHTAIVWDMPGHGRSDAPDDASQYAPGRFVEHMLALVVALLCGSDEAEDR